MTDHLDETQVNSVDMPNIILASILGLQCEERLLQPPYAPEK